MTGSALPSFVSFRDAGALTAALGSPTAPGILFRTNLPESITDAEWAHLEGLGVRAVIDLRDEGEIHDQPSPFAAPNREAQWTINHVPLFAGSAESLVAEGAELEDIYEHLATNSGHAIASALSHIAEAPGPVIVHCTAGKDRTGVVVAIALALAGADDRDITSDYALTEQRLAGPWLTNRVRILSEYHGDDVSDRMRLLGGSPASVITETLTALRERWGSIESFVTHYGLSATHLSTLRHKLQAAL